MYNEKKEEEVKDTLSFQEFFQKMFHKRTKRLFTDLDRLFTNIMWIEIGLSVLLILVGVLFLLNPTLSLNVIGILFGIVVLCFGGLNIYAYLKSRELYFFKFHIIYGILDLILGVLIIISPFTFTQLITIFIGFWLIYLAVMKIDLAMRLKRLSEKSWLTLLVSAILSIFMSILIFINPFTNILFAQLAGAYCVLSGILNATNAVLTKNRSIDFLENL